MRRGDHPLVHLGDVVDEIFIASRFGRVYVSEEHEVPFLQGSHLPQLRPEGVRYLSKEENAAEIQEFCSHSGWVLVTRSGTVGRTAVVSEAKVGWTASEHLLRIVPDCKRAHPGYVTAFLRTPCGQHQLTAKIYGGVVDEFSEADTADVGRRDAPAAAQRSIGEKVVSAYNKTDGASPMEESAIRYLERLLEARARTDGYG